MYGLDSILGKPVQLVKDEEAKLDNTLFPHKKAMKYITKALCYLYITDVICPRYRRNFSVTYYKVFKSSP